MTEEALIDEIRDYVHSIHTAEPFHGFSFRELREVGEHFALPREKRIEELIALINAERERQEKCDDVHLRKIAELEKENAELKGLKDVATLIRANNDTVTTLMQLNNMLVSKSQQLTKAKEIIKGLLSFVDSLGNYSGGIFAKAKQFLNEVEK